MEALSEFLVSGKPLAEQFDGNLAFKRHIMCLVDNRHSPGAQRVFQPVAIS
jgi:hypothetical protein